MNIDKALEALEAAATAINTAKAQLLSDAPPSTEVIIKSTDNLQAALDKGGEIRLEADAVFLGSFKIKSNTTLYAQGAKFSGIGAPALIIPPGTSNIFIYDLKAESTHPTAILIGENSINQTSVGQAPLNITLDNVLVMSHRGKRGIEIHGAQVYLIDCQVLDLYDPAGQDSQAVYVGNAPGPIKITGGRYSAGSEVILFGGDVTKIPNLTPSDILIDGVELFRPIEWRLDGVKRKVKNIFELKNAKNVVLRNSKLHGCWVDGQQGEAIVLTPALDGEPKTPPLQSGNVQNVLIEDCEIYDVSSGFNMLGRHYSAYTPDAMSNIVVRRVKITASKAFGGRGQLALIAGEPGSITFDSVTVKCDGSSFIYYAPGKVIDPVTKVYRPAGKLDALTLLNSYGFLGVYGIMLGANANALRWQDSVNTLTVSGNTFSGATTMKATLPDNTYGAATL